MSTMDDTGDSTAEAVPTALDPPSSAQLFGEFGLNGAPFYEYETPFDRLAAVDGD